MIRIVELRKARGKSQGQMAKLLGLTQQAYCNYEKGIRQIPDELKIKIADYFEVSVDYLLGRTENPHFLEGSESDLVIPPVLKDVGIAFHGGPEELSQEDIDDVAKFVEFLRAKKKEENKKSTPN